MCDPHSYIITKSFMTHISHCSAPGKVLITGGYLILDRNYRGVVISTTSFFHTTIASLEGNHNHDYIISVKSPQFEDGYWQYKLRMMNQEKSCLIERVKDTSENKYLETTLNLSLNLIIARRGLDEFSQLLKGGIEIEIRGGNDFYSQREQLIARNLSLTSQGLSQLPPFSQTHKKISQVNKTGLGSSAAMVTSLVGALITHFDILASEPHAQTLLIHNLAQVCHCLSQGKIGSGFDVSSAIYGSQIYRRFDPSILTPLVNMSFADVAIGGLLNDITSKRWDSVVKPIRLPLGLQLVLAEVQGGTSSPSMVSSLLKWKKENFTIAQELWNDLDILNRNVETGFEELLKLENEPDYVTTINDLSKKTSAGWSVTNKTSFHLVELFTSFQKIRSIWRKITELSKIPIEPASQTALLDASLECPGVLCAGIPGSGGYDAIFCIVLNESVISNLEDMWLTWTETPVCPLLSREGKNGIKIWKELN